MRTRLGDARCVVAGGTLAAFFSLDDLVQDGQTGAMPRRDETPAVVMYTSGTTGKPKVAECKYRIGVMAGAMALIGETPMQVGKKQLTRVVRSTMQEAVEWYRITTTAMVPTMLHRLVELGEETIRRYDTSSLEVIFSGCAPLARDVMCYFGDTLYNFYGAAETGVVTLAKPDESNE